MTFPPQGFPPPEGRNPWPDHDPFGAGPSAPWGSDPFAAGQQPGWPAQPPEPGAPPPNKKNNRALLIVLTVVAVVVAATGLGAALWGLNSRGGTEKPTATAQPSSKPASTGTASSATAAPEPMAPSEPLGPERPPADLQLQVPLEQKPAAIWTVKPDSWKITVLGGGSETVAVGYTTGVMAMDAATGKNRWPKPVMPSGAYEGYFYLSNCVTDRTERTLGCALRMQNGDDAVIVFFDVKTGAQRGKAVSAERISSFRRAGNGFVLTTFTNQLTGYRGDGSEAWTAQHDGVSIFGDQGLVVTKDGRVLDADTGSVVLQYRTSPSSKLAFTRGFALSDGPTIDLYDFAGKPTGSVPSEGFSLMPTSREHEGSSGLDVPVVYNAQTSQVRALDPTSGNTLWSKQVSQDLSQTVWAFGSGDTCVVIAVNPDNTQSALTQKCGTEASATFIGTGSGEPNPVIGFDGQRLVVHQQSANVCLDAATGQSLWTLDDSIREVRWVGNKIYGQVEREGSVVRLA
ncbi:hypothetical protein EB73_26860 [Mycobacterium sp. SWH-M3]|nr:hypothetical protein EB73_26860 [Mycobacterium sp. SWH-M3]